MMTNLKGNLLQTKTSVRNLSQLIPSSSSEADCLTREKTIPSSVCCFSCTASQPQVKAPSYKNFQTEWQWSEVICGQCSEHAQLWWGGVTFLDRHGNFLLGFQVLAPKHVKLYVFSAKHW